MRRYLLATTALLMCATPAAAKDGSWCPGGARHHLPEGSERQCVHRLYDDDAGFRNRGIADHGHPLLDLRTLNASAAHSTSTRRPAGMAMSSSVATSKCSGSKARSATSMRR